MKLIVFILGCMIGWAISQVLFSEEKAAFAVDCTNLNGMTFEHMWVDGAPFWQYNQYRNTTEGKDYSRGEESYYHCSQCSKVKVLHQNGDIEIFTPILRSSKIRVDPNNVIMEKSE